MITRTSRIHVKTNGHGDTLDITRKVAEAAGESGCTTGIVSVFVPGSTAGITTIEFESGVVDDLRQAIERLAPEEIRYKHDARWGDGNGYAHVRAALVGPSLTVPMESGDLLLGTWQQIVLIDFDNRSRSRDVVVTVMGE